MSFEELTDNELIKLNVKEYSSVELNYRMVLLKDLKLVNSQSNDTLAIDSFNDFSNLFDDNFNSMSVTRYTSNSDNLIEEWDKLLSDRVDIGNDIIYSEGYTDYLEVDSYYKYSSYELDDIKTEAIYFLLQGEVNVFYLLRLSAHGQENYPDNLKGLLYCAKSIKIN